MSEPASSRTDPLVPNPSAATTEGVPGSLATLPESGLDVHGQMEQMAERLRFYESFDALIQQNIARSGQLMREAGEKRDEAVEAIARSRQQVETGRETQRAALSELLDDVMTIQQATERLAHRVSDALEQIEFELEPIGLQGHAALGGAAPARLPGMTDGGAFARTDAEDVHDEFSRGVLGHGQPASTVPTSGSMRSGSVVTSGETNPVGGPAAAWSSATAEGDNPETDAPASDEPIARDIGTAEEPVSDELADRESGFGEGAEGAPIETDAAAWSTADTVGSIGIAGADDRSPMAESTTTAQEDGLAAAPVTTTDELDGSVPEAAQPVTGELVGLAAEEPGVDAAPAQTIGTDPGVTESTAPAADGHGDTEPLTSDDLDASDIAEDADQTVPASSTDDLGADTTARSDAVHATAMSPSANGSVAPVIGSPAASSATATEDQTRAPGGDVAAGASEQRTTVVLDGVPRAAVALALQRHILSRPDVLRAEVREYYDHRLTLFVTGRRATTADDLADWDASATWEQIRTSPELLELRMQM